MYVCMYVCMYMPLLSFLFSLSQPLSSLGSCVLFLVMYADNSFMVKVDDRLVYQGNLASPDNFAPSLQPPRTVADADDKKPTDWVDDKTVGILEELWGVYFPVLEGEEEPPSYSAFLQHSNYIYIYMCVCVCVCECVFAISLRTKDQMIMKGT